MLCLTLYTSIVECQCSDPIQYMWGEKYAPSHLAHHILYVGANNSQQVQKAPIIESSSKRQLLTIVLVQTQKVRGINS